MTPTATPDLSEFDRLAARFPARRSPCPIGAALSVLDKNERAQLEAALVQPNNVYPAKIICDWLGKRGFSIKYGRVKSHRKGECSCHEA